MVVFVIVLINLPEFGSDDLWVWVETRGDLPSRAGRSAGFEPRMNPISE
jgi:hypothetical protein